MRRLGSYSHGNHARRTPTRRDFLLSLRVTWSMSGRKNSASKGFGLFMNLDKMVGGDFEKGLAQLKGVAEASAKNN